MRRFVIQTSYKYPIDNKHTETHTDDADSVDDPAEETGMTKKEVLNVRLPDELMQVLDDFVDDSNYRNRSEAIRAFAREYVLEHKGDNNAG